jgi:hypothetical protein
MHNAGILVPIFISLGAFAMVFGIVYLRTRENLAMLEKGKDPRTPRPYRSLKTGLLLLGGGLGLFIAYMIDVNGGMNMHDNPAIYFSLIAIGGGAGLVCSYLIEKKAMLRGEDTE